MVDLAKPAAPEAPEGMRPLDEAVGGGFAPIGPLGGPAPKTRIELLAEEELKAEASGEQEEIDKAKAEIKVEQAKAEATAA